MSPHSRERREKTGGTGAHTDTNTRSYKHTGAQKKRRTAVIWCKNGTVTHTGSANLSIDLHLEFAQKLKIPQKNNQSFKRKNTNHLKSPGSCVLGELGTLSEAEEKKSRLLQPPFFPLGEHRFIQRLHADQRQLIQKEPVGAKHSVSCTPRRRSAPLLSRQKSLIYKKKQAPEIMRKDAP